MRRPQAERGATPGARAPVYTVNVGAATGDDPCDGCACVPALAAAVSAPDSMLLDSPFTSPLATAAWRTSSTTAQQQPRARLYIPPVYG
jgi:hypothetical protein